MAKGDGMERVVYAIFKDHTAAQGAIDKLLGHGVPTDVIDLVMHEGTVDAGQLAGSAGLSRRYCFFGCLIIGGLGALVGSLVAGWFGAALGALWGVFGGAIGTAIAGGPESKKKLRDLVPQVRRGRVLVTVDISGKKQAGLDLERLLAARGALQVGMT
jgi:hypothetical protein